MHEGAIAESIVDILKDSVDQNKLNSIIKVKLNVGILSGVMVDALLFALEALKNEENIIKDAEFCVIESDVVARCVICDKEYKFKKGEDISLLCSECGMPLDIISGKEMEIIEIEGE